ncbi:MspA family porin [Nocardia huaxiensis]|uniref:MspA family porin n=1 Tax=Nocardia huaxiensis TaxID=2755382 RepID=UPI001E5D8689|nr:MspA family porin [Nocardia huaxiensis]UFS99418.1 MspA family porin [Nocardia huaxiensis]
MDSKLGIFSLFITGATFLYPASAHAEVEPLPPHERIYQTVNGSFTVGHREEIINRLAPLNMVGTTREALVSNIAYGQLAGPFTGTLKTGYHVGCAVNTGAGTIGVTPDLTLGATIPLGDGAPNLALGANPNPVATLNLTAGEVKEVPVAEKEIVSGAGQIVIRDFHIIVNQCTGPVAIRHYTYLFTKSPAVDDSGAVFGEPTWL